MNFQRPASRRTTLNFTKVAALLEGGVELTQPTNRFTRVESLEFK